MIQARYENFINFEQVSCTILQISRIINRIALDIVENKTVSPRESNDICARHCSQTERSLSRFSKASSERGNAAISSSLAIARWKVLSVVGRQWQKVANARRKRRRRRRCARTRRNAEKPDKAGREGGRRARGKIGIAVDGH